jgi:hypothetical protein
VLILGTLVAFAQKLPEKGVPFIAKLLLPRNTTIKAKYGILASTPKRHEYIWLPIRGCWNMMEKTWSSFTGSAQVLHQVAAYCLTIPTIFTGSDLRLWSLEKETNFMAFEYSSLVSFQARGYPKFK